MAQIIKQGNILGRIGSGVGKGLAEQVPKEIERARLSSGLANFEQEHGNLNPIQQLARLSAIPGITPQMIQSFSELAKQQNTRNAYLQRGGQREPSQRKSGQELNNIQFANMQQGQPSQSRQGQPSVNNQNVNQDEFGQPQIVQQNPLREEAIPKTPWTPERRNEERARLYEDFPNLQPREIEEMAADNEARELAQPAAQQNIDTYLKQQQSEAENKFTNLLETKLQKTKEGVYSDITGEMLNNLKRSMNRELRTNPRATVEDVANKWSDKALELAKDKKLLQGLADNDFTTLNVLTKKDATKRQLDNFAKTFKNAGNSEEYFNTLKSGFNFSPQGAASIAFPRSKNVKDYISKVKESRMSTLENHSANSRKIASEIENLITSDDSLLAIVKDLRERDPFFDQYAFFQQLTEDRDTIRLNPRQIRELEATPQDLPNWSDLLVFPVVRGVK